MDLKHSNVVPSSNWESHWKLFRLAQASSTGADKAAASACSAVIDIMTKLVSMSLSRRRRVSTSAASVCSSDKNSETILYELLLSKLRALCCLVCVSQQSITGISAETVSDMLSYLSDKKLSSSPISNHSLMVLSFACENMVANRAFVQTEVMPVFFELLRRNGADRLRLLLGQTHAYDLSVEKQGVTVPDIALLRLMHFVSEQMPGMRYRTISSIIEAVLRRFSTVTHCDSKRMSTPLSTAVQSVIEMWLIIYIQHASIFTTCNDAGTSRSGSTPSSQPKRLRLFGNASADVDQFTVLCAFPATDADEISKGYDVHLISQVCNENIFSRFKMLLKTLHADELEAAPRINVQSVFSEHESEIKSFFENSIAGKTDAEENERNLATQLYVSFRSRVTDSHSLLSCIVKYCDSILTLCRTMASSVLPLHKRSCRNSNDAERDTLCKVAVHALDCLRLIVTDTSTFSDDICAQGSAALDTYIDRLCFTQEGVDVLKYVLHGSLPTMLNVVVSMAGHAGAASSSSEKSCADHAYIYRRIQTVFATFLAVPDYLVISLRRWALLDSCCKCVAERNLSIAYHPHLAIIIDHLPALFFALLCNPKLHLFAMLRVIPALLTRFPLTSFEILFDLVVNMPLLAQAVDVYLLISDEALSAAGGSDCAFATPALLAFRDPALSDTYAFMKRLTPAFRRLSYAVMALKTTEEFNCSWPLLMESSQNENELLKLEYRPRVADAVDVMPTLLSKLLEVVQQHKHNSATVHSEEISASTLQNDKVMHLVLSKIFRSGCLNSMLLRSPHIHSKINQLLSDAVTRIISNNFRWLTNSRIGADEEAEQRKFMDVVTEHISCQFLLRSPPVFAALVRAVGITLVQQLPTASASMNSDLVHRRFYEALESATYEIVRQNGELRYKQHLLNDELVLEAVIALLEALAALGCCGSCSSVVIQKTGERALFGTPPAVTVSDTNVVDSNYARRTVICFNNLMQRMQAMPADDNYRATVVQTIELLVQDYNMPSLNDVVRRLASANELQVEPEVVEALQRQMTPSHSGEFATVVRRSSSGTHTKTSDLV